MAQTLPQLANLPTRNNNPGNIRGAGGAFVKFKTPLEGQIALYNDLTVKMTGQSKTGLKPQSSLYEFAQKYAPKSDGNDPANYAANIANELGISPDTQIGSLVPRVDDFAKAIAKHEGYKGQWIEGKKTAPQQQQQPANKKPGYLPITPIPNAPVASAAGSPALRHPNAGQQAANVGNILGQGLGMGPLGQGLATAINQFQADTMTQASNPLANPPTHSTADAEKNAQAAAAKQASDIMGKYPVGSPERQAAFANYNKLYGGGVPGQGEIDPGTLLKKGDVLKSAAKTAAATLAGGSLPGKGAATGILSRGTAVKSPLLVQGISKGYKAVKPVVESGGIIGNLIKGILLDKTLKTTTGKGLLDLFKYLDL